LKNIFLSLWYFRKNLFIHFLAYLPQKFLFKNLQIWAYYKLGMFHYALEIQPYRLTCRGYVGKICSYAALGENIKAKRLLVEFESLYFCEEYYKIVYNFLVPYFGFKLIEEKKEGYLSDALVISLYIKYAQKNVTSIEFENFFKKLSLDPLFNPELFLIKSNLVTEKDINSKLKLLNEYLAFFDLSPLKLLSDTTYLNVNTLDSSNVQHTETKKLVSVIMTCYNSSKSIEKSVISILNQTYVNLELIVVDDASSDATVNIVQNIASRDFRVKVIQLKKNVGTYVAKNLALTFAKGDYVMCHDSDDYSHPLKIELQVKPLIDNDDLVATISNWVRIDEKGNYVTRFVYPFSRMNLSSLMFRKDMVVNKIGYYDTVRTGADSEFYARLLLIFGKTRVLRIKKPLSLGAHREDSLMNAPGTGYNKNGISNDRLNYWESWNIWHINEIRSKRTPFLNFGEDSRKFKVPQNIEVGIEDVIFTQNNYRVVK